MSELVPSQGNPIQLASGGLGYVVSEAVSFEQLQESIRVQGSVVGLGLLLLGDLLNRAEELFGESHAQAIESYKYDEKTVRNCMWIAKKWPLEDRRPNLTYSHYGTLAGMKDLEARTELAEEASQQHWTVTTLAERRDEKIGRKTRNHAQDAPQRTLSPDPHEECRKMLQAVLDTFKPVLAFAGEQCETTEPMSEEERANALRQVEEAQAQAYHAESFLEKTA